MAAQARVQQAHVQNQVRASGRGAEGTGICASRVQHQMDQLIAGAHDTRHSAMNRDSVLVLRSMDGGTVRNMDWIYRNIPGAKVERRTHQSLNVPEQPGQTVYQTLIELEVQVCTRLLYRRTQKNDISIYTHRYIRYISRHSNISVSLFTCLLRAFRVKQSADLSAVHAIARLGYAGAKSQQAKQARKKQKAQKKTARKKLMAVAIARAI